MGHLFHSVVVSVIKQGYCLILKVHTKVPRAVSCLEKDQSTISDIYGQMAALKLVNRRQGFVMKQPMCSNHLGVCIQPLMSES